MSTTSRLSGHSHNTQSITLFCLLGLLIVINYATAIDYAAYREDPMFRGPTSHSARTTREILEQLNLRNSPSIPTLQDATERYLNYGALWRMEILETFGKLVYDHYDDFGMSQIEALYRIYRETLERKYNIFDIVPSILEDPDTRPTKICSHINKHISTCLKESSNICMNVTIHDEPHDDAISNSARNITRRIYHLGQIKRNYPNGFSLKAVLYHLRAGRLRFTSSLFSALLHNIQYDNFDDKVRTAERELAAFLGSSLGNSISLKHENAEINAGTISQLLKNYLEHGEKLFPGKMANYAGYLSKHVVREIDAVSENIELLGTVYDNSTINLRYLFELILPNDTVDIDIIEARDYLLLRIVKEKIIENYVRVEKYQQTGPDQLLMEILGQLSDIHFSENLVASLYAHARFWHKSHMIENLNDLLELFDTYENLRGIDDFRELVRTIDIIKNNLRDSRNLTIEFLCTRPRECLRIGLEIISNCAIVNDETKGAIQLFIDRTSYGCSRLMGDSSFVKEKGTSESSRDYEGTEGTPKSSREDVKDVEKLEGVKNDGNSDEQNTVLPGDLTNHEDGHNEKIEALETENKKEDITLIGHEGNENTGSMSQDITEINTIVPDKIFGSNESQNEQCTGNNCKIQCEGDDCIGPASSENCVGPDCLKNSDESESDCEGSDCGENSSKIDCEGDDCNESSCEDGNCSENSESSDECKDCGKNSTTVNPCEGSDCPVKNCTGHECGENEITVCQGSDCPESSIVNNCVGDDCQEAGKENCEGSDCPMKEEIRCKGDDCPADSPQHDCDGKDCSENVCKGPDCPNNSIVDCQGPDCPKINCTGIDCPLHGVSHECEGSNCPGNVLLNSTSLTQCRGIHCPIGNSGKSCEGSDCPEAESKEGEICEGSNCSDSSAAQNDCEGKDCPEINEPETKEDCEGFGCTSDKNEMKEDCEGEDCPLGKVDEICKGPNCSINEEEIKEDCEGKDCPKAEIKENCEGPDCASNEKETKEDCEGENCPKKDEENECEGSDCPKEKVEEDCTGPDCPIDGEQKEKEDCEDQRCETGNAEMSCEGPDCLTEPYQEIVTPCNDENDTKNCSSTTEEMKQTEESTSVSPSTSIVNKTSRATTFCDNSDPHYRRRLHRLRKMRLIDALSSTPRSSYEVFNSFFETSADKKTKIPDDTQLETKISNKTSLKTKNTKKETVKMENREKINLRRNNRGYNPVPQVLENTGTSSRRAASAIKKIERETEKDNATNSYKITNNSKNSSNRTTLRENRKNYLNDLSIKKFVNSPSDKADILGNSVVKKELKKLGGPNDTKVVKKMIIYDEDDENAESDDHSSIEKIISHQGSVKVPSNKNRTSKIYETKERENTESMSRKSKIHRYPKLSSFQTPESSAERGIKKLIIYNKDNKDENDEDSSLGETMAHKTSVQAALKKNRLSKIYTTKEQQNIGSKGMMSKWIFRPQIRENNTYEHPYWTIDRNRKLGDQGDKSMVKWLIYNEADKNMSAGSKKNQNLSEYSRESLENRRSKTLSKIERNNQHEPIIKRKALKAGKHRFIRKMYGVRGGSKENSEFELVPTMYETKEGETNGSESNTRQSIIKELPRTRKKYQHSELSGFQPDRSQQ